MVISRYGAEHLSGQFNQIKINLNLTDKYSDGHGGTIYERRKRTAIIEIDKLSRRVGFTSDQIKGLKIDVMFLDRLFD